MRIRYTGGIYLLSGYVCCLCQTRHKLWRRDGNDRLLCLTHIAQEVGVYPTSFTWDGYYIDDSGVTDTVAGWFPAAPMEANDDGFITSYFDYGAIPVNARRWWQGPPPR